MTYTTRLLSLAALSALTANASLAQESLTDIYQRALQNDPLIRQEEANYLAIAQVKPLARSNLLPSLDFGADATATYSESPFGATFPDGSVVGRGTEFDRTGDSWSIGLSQTIFNWAQITTLRQADKEVTRAETLYEAAKQTLLIRVAETYFAVLASEETLASEVANVEAIGRQLEQAQRRFEVGLIAITEVEQAQANFDLAVANEIQAERLLSTAQEALRELIGEYITNLARPTDDLPLLTPEPASVNEWVSLALQQNLTLISSRLAADIADDGVKIQRAVRLPTVSFSAAYNDSESLNRLTLFATDPMTGDVLAFPRRNRNASEGYNWSLNLRVPLFAGGFNEARIQQSVYERRAAMESLEGVARATERQTRDAYLGVISEISRVQALAQAVESSQTALRATEAGFEVGTQTTVDVLVQQEILRRAQTNYALSRYDYLLNGLRLKEAAGSLAVQDIEQIDTWLE